MQNLDLWLEFVDTKEIIPLFEKNAREYIIPKLTEVDWSSEPDYLIQIAKEKSLSAFKALESETQYGHVFDWLFKRNEKNMLLQSFKYLLGQLRDSDFGLVKTPMMVQTMLDFLKHAPFLSVTFAQIDSWTTLPPEVYRVLGNSGPEVLQGHILSANEMQEFVVEPFKRVMSQIQSMSLTDFADLVELISLTVHSSDIALDLLLGCLEQESTRVLPGDLAMIQHFVRNIIGIALDHIDEAAQPHISREELLDLKLRPGSSEGYLVVESQLRIDAPTTGTLALKDHVRLTSASSPANSVTAQLCSVDALVESSQPGLATFHCLHPLPPFVEQCSWKLQNCGSFVTTKTMFDAVLTLATQRQECCGITEQILGTQKDPFNGRKMLPIGFTVEGNLNASQNAAVEASLCYPLTCLWGPPGTGKTYTIVEIIKQLQASQENRRILVTAPTHNAVDNVMRKYLAGVMRSGRLDTAQQIAIRVSTDVSLVSPNRQYSSNLPTGSESS
jgi:regulator of nonsense transcripts 1